MKRETSTTVLLSKTFMIIGGLFAFIYQFFNLVAIYFLAGYESYDLSIYSVLRFVIGLLPAALFLCVVFHNSETTQQYQLLSGSLIAAGVVDFVLRVLTAFEQHLDTSQIVNFVFFGNMENHPDPDSWIIMVPGILLIIAAILFLKRDNSKRYYMAQGLLLVLCVALLYDLYTILSIVDFAIFGPLMVLYFVADTLSLLFLLIGSLIFSYTHR